MVEKDDETARADEAGEKRGDGCAANAAEACDKSSAIMRGIAPEDAGAPAIVFSDMDGTFLTSDKRVTDVNWRALDALAERGIEFVVCTGRAANALPSEILSHPAARYAVCANGAYTLDTQTQTRIGTIGLPLENVLDLYELCRPRDAICDLFADGVAYTHEEDIVRLPEFITDPGQFGFVSKTRVSTPHRIPELVKHVEQLERITVFCNEPDDRAAVCGYVDAHPELTWSSSYLTAIEITSSAATKGSGLAHLCEHLGIDASRAFAFGDHLNDISMIEAAGVGVAMANAVPEAKAAADAVCLSNEESGEGRFILAALGL